MYNCAVALLRSLKYPEVINEELTPLNIIEGWPEGHAKNGLPIWKGRGRR